MKKIITLMLVLLFMFSITLTGCGGDTEEPAAAPEVETEATITMEQLGEKYNEVATLFNELDGVLLENGTYDSDETVKTQMDTIIDTLDKAAPVIQANNMTDEDITTYYEVFDTFLIALNDMKDTYAN